MYTTSVAHDWDFLLVSPHKTAGCVRESFHKVCVHHREVLSGTLTQGKRHWEEKEPPLIHSTTTFWLAFILLLFWRSTESRINANPSSAVGGDVWEGPEAVRESPIFHSPDRHHRHAFTPITHSSPANLASHLKIKLICFYNLINLFLNLKSPTKWKWEFNGFDPRFKVDADVCI